MKKKFELITINPNLEFFQPTNCTIVGMFNNCGSATTLEETRHCNHEQTYYTTILTSLPLFGYIWNVDKGTLCEALETWGKGFYSKNCVEDQMCQPCLVITGFMVMST
jgi:hypothetical protein